MADALAPPPLPAWEPGTPAGYGSRYADALALAAWGHRRQVRKRGPDEPAGPGTPYIGHVLEVSALAWVAGADEDQAVAAVLHDALEDWPDGDARLDQDTVAALLERRFGPRVLSLVRACTDRDPAGSGRRDASTWRPRKEEHLHRLAGLPPDHLLVPAADKVANVRAILDDLADGGVDVWRRFHAEPPDLHWYYRAASLVLAERLPGSLLTRRLAVLVDRLGAVLPGRAPG